ncbi:cell surface protein SprA [Chryseolinea sp. Jin1]|uniref:Cell surface protein SprA n=2 Tax=Chryseolinea lacunae TaxID=2801331 RepID=A0ABS1KS99_9BACT|nr:cell surface protein SprA [Chryseolinea lacunae]
MGFGQVRPTRQNPADTTKRDAYTPSRRPTYRATDRYGDPFSNTTTASPLYLKDPNQMKLDVDIDTAMNYTIYEKIGDLNYRPASSMSFSEFKQYQDRQILKSYWKGRARAQDGESAVSGRSLIPKIFISPVLDRIFGGSYVELVPRGFVTLDLGAAFQRLNNPNIPIRQQRNGGFEFDQQINMSVVGKVGEKLAVTANFDNNNSFDFQNNMKVEYTGFKEDILQKLEIGNVSLPLNNTLIQGAQNLFGIKAKMQFGKLDVTAIATTQRGKTASINLGGNNNSGQGRPFEFIASNYDENRHFFLGQFFRDNYEAWVSNPPQIISGVNITRVEVYILNRNNDTQTLRNVMAFMDLAEPTRIYNSQVTPTSVRANDNKANILFDRVKGLQRDADGIIDAVSGAGGPFTSMVNGTDYEKITGARKLSPTEFTFHQQLGYITLTRKLQNDEALAVAYEYTYNGRAYRVGELSDDYASLKDNEVVFLKLLRPRKVAVRDNNKNILPTWDLMMKNIYNLNVTQLVREGFQLRVIYRDDKSGIDNPQLQEGTRVRTRQLVEVLGLDKLNPVNDPQKDGNFDYIEGVTINSTTGMIIFPFLHPFSKGLREAFRGESNESYLIQKYAFDTLYHTTKADAELFATKNKFYLKGLYSAGSSKEILIPGFGVSQGSVKLYAGGIPLNEGTDYVVDYTFGKVTILNESILSSGKNIEVKYEQSDPFAFQTRSLLGSRFDYHLTDDINLGSTFLYYNERPLISRNQIGTEPARNMQYGVDFNVNKKSRMLTKMVDALPFLQTKEQSTVTMTGEFAQLLPGTSNVIDGEGTAYIDDFENTATPYSLMAPAGWKLSSVPKSDDWAYDPSNGQPNMIEAGFKRAKIAWYQVDNQLYRDVGQFKPKNITDNDLKNHYVRPVGPKEIFPLRQLPQGIFYEQIFDVAYYPRERGPYNYNPLQTSEGFLNTPESNWGAITNAIRTEVDFDKANIEYVEFWLLDPFINSQYGYIDDGITATPQPNRTGGKLVFQLGSISEDVARDSKHAFENGLPRDGNPNAGGASQNAWGYVTTQQYLTNAFDNDASARAFQDVGLDGMSTATEATFFQDYINQLSGAARDKAIQDPSADNFKYFLGSDLDDANAQILERYKNINGQDGNSPVITGADAVTPSGSTIPDNEDLNADNTLSELEEYYQYDMDLKPGGLGIGKEYIVDAIQTDPATSQNSPERVTWYLFRIPVRQFEEKFGNIDGFKSIKYARMLLTGFKDPVVLRFANFRMVGSRWRRYTDNLLEGDLKPDPELDPNNFTVNVVNLEENAAASENKSGYVIPPGVVRDRDNTSSVPRQLNEQSVQVCVEGLNDGDSRAIYKNASVDLFNYGRVKMYFHANSTANDGDLHAFLRMGTDFDQNYYEIEIPLKITRPVESTDPNEIWPSENDIDIALDELYALKAQRDREGFPLTELFPREGPKQVDRHLIRIFGRPDLSSVQVLMIGIRNPKTADRKTLSACIWANELRVTDFNRTPGWAVSSTISAKLADFATVTGAFRHTTFGFGNVSSKIFERTRDETTSYDVSANVNVDKLLPGNTGIKIPMFASFQNTTINPNYDPANPDMKIDAALKSFNTDDERNAYLKLIRDQETRRSLNFINVRKVKTRADAPIRLWDIENFAFSYSYSEAMRSNFTIKESVQKQYKGSIAYTFSPKNTGIEPFKNSTGLNSPWLKVVKDFNFSLMPSSIGVRLDLDRSFGKNVYRNDGFVSAPNYLKYFTFNRQYNVRWNLSKNLSFDYNSRMNAIIDEPDGEGDSVRAEIKKNLKKLGRAKLFDQSLTANYTVPLDKIPATDWLGADYRYNVSFNWRAGPRNDPDLPSPVVGQPDIVVGLPDSLDFKNTIQNQREQNFTGRIDMIKLYNKIKFLKELNAAPKVSTRTNPKVPPKPSKADTVKQKTMPGLAKGFFRLLMSLRSINGTYTLSEGTILPGFLQTPKYFGMDQDWNAPGWGFILGSQDPNIRFKAANNGWLTDKKSLTMPFTQQKNQSINLRANIEPSPDLKIQVDFKKETTNSFQSIFRKDSTGGYSDLNPSRGGSYRISFNTIRTAFNKSNGGVESEVFHQFEQNLAEIKDRFRQFSGAEFDSTSQDVVIPAFIAAYSGKDAKTISLSPFPKIPMPNWRIDYTGLNKINFFKNAFQSITISHGYQSSYSVMNYSNSLEFNDPGKLVLNQPIEDYNRTYFGSKNSEGNYTPVYVISQVLISEQFAPLFGVNVRTKSRVTANFQYKTKRDLSLTISNAQITELVSKDISFELGFTKNNMKLPFKSEGRLIVLKNDVTFRLNATVSDSKTIQRKVDELNVVTNGNINIQLRPNISYVVNQKLNVQAYFERTINEPQVSNSYRRATTRFGVQIRFSLAQ